MEIKNRFFLSGDKKFRLFHFQTVSFSDCFQTERKHATNIYHISKRINAQKIVKIWWKCHEIHENKKKQKWVMITWKCCQMQSINIVGYVCYGSWEYDVSIWVRMRQLWVLLQHWPKGVSWAGRVRRVKSCILEWWLGFYQIG